jgi:YidC/Oxa1 family membrane protein insertase
MASEQRRLLLALVLSGLVLFGWQTYFAPKNDTVQPVNNDTRVNTDVSKPAATTSLAKDVMKNVPVNSEVSNIILVSNEYSVSINSSFKVSKISNKNLTDNYTKTAGENSSFAFYLVENNKLVPFNFSFTQTEEGKVNGLDSLRGVSFESFINKKGMFEWKVSSQKPVNIAVEVTSTPKEDESRQIRQFVHYGSEVKRHNIDDEETYESKSNWFALDYHYHLIAAVLNNEVSSQTFVKNNVMLTKTIGEGSRDYSGFFIYEKKELDLLKSLGHKLDLAIDYGIFGIIAVPILKGLKFFYSYIPNYGVAIILITLLIRLLLFPLQFKSFKSMKKMQKLQPQLQKIKDKYKDEPQKVQKETMELFKKSGANPMGGCLPMLLQMPVFFAMYQVFLHSVELLGAPFVLWITDLSIKDPYYVLPVLMGASFFLQTKLNPSTTADPNQQKIMLFMPLIFPFFMKDLPAGLNLYMFVSTSFGILQQMFVYKVIDD